MTAPEPRQWVIEYPPGTGILTANSRLNKYAANDVTQNLKQVTWRLAAQVLKMPQLERVSVVAEYQNPPRRKADRHPMASDRVEDHDAIYPTRKACVDGLVLAGVLPKGDSVKKVTNAECVVLPGTHPRGLLRIVVTEVLP